MAASSPSSPSASPELPRASEGPSLEPSWRWFSGFAAVGALVVFGFVTLASVGLFVLPLGVLALALTALRAHTQSVSSADLLGFLEGAAAVCFVVALANRDYQPCPTGSRLEQVAGGYRSSCGGFDPLPWLIAGIFLALAGMAAYLLVRRRNPLTPGSGPGPRAAVGE